jgi:hypothetical protein
LTRLGKEKRQMNHAETDGGAKHGDPLKKLMVGRQRGS